MSFFRAALALAITLSVRPAAANADSPSKERSAAEEETQPDSPAPSLSLSLLLQKQFSLSSSPEASPSFQADLSSPAQKKFLPAFLEVTAFNVIPNRWNCWVRGKECVTLDSWRENLHRGFAYDPDKFATNNLSHPQQGGLYYAAARSNGFNLYESALFTFYGSLTWEYFGETTRPSTNDLIVTTLSGVSSGETSYRLSDLVFDDTETGFKRFLRELAGMAVAPGRALHRLTTGEAWHVAPNTAEKPAWLDFDLAGGWVRVESSRPSAETVLDRATLPMNLDYGNPFERDLGKPFSSFHLEAEFTNGKNAISRVQTEGILSARRLDGPGSDGTLVGASFIFDYLDLDLSFGQEALGFGVWSRRSLGRGWELLSRAALLASFAAVQSSEESSPSTSRNYDYGVGGGVRAGFRLRHEGRDVARLGLDELFLSTVNGPTRWNEVTIARGSAWLPLSRALSVGTEYSWQRHRNVFPEETQLRTSGQARVMVGWAVWSGTP